MNRISFINRYQQLWNDTVSVGPAMVPFSVIAILLSVLVVYATTRRFVQKERRTFLWDNVTNAFLWGFIVWKLSPLVQFHAAIRRDPVLLLRMPGGQLGLILGATAAMIILVRSVLASDSSLRTTRVLDLSRAMIAAAFVAALLTAMVTVIRTPTLQTQVPAVPETLPITLLDAQPTTFANLRGRPVLLSFWATWCAPCRAEFPHKVQFFEQYGHELTFLAVNLTATEPNVAAVRTYVQRNELPFPIALDADNRLANAFLVRGTPTTVLIDGEGIVIQRWAGPISFDRLQHALKQIRR